MQLPVEVGQKIRDLFAVIFQANRKTARVRRLSQPDVVLQLVFVGQRETCVIGEAMDIVGVYAVAFLLGGKIEAADMIGASKSIF